jgi:hypothetical protein
MRRREFLVSASVTALGGAGVVACGGTGFSKSIDKHDLPGYFSQFQADDEPNADLAKIIWPSYVTKADPEVKTLYEFQLTHGDLMKYMPCYCGCGKRSGHNSNRDCYVDKVNSDGSAVLDSMAPT